MVTQSKSPATLDLSVYGKRLKAKWNWAQKRINDALEGYRKFLTAKASNPKLIPTPDVDEVWHMHILDTRRYRDDCEELFGEFLHHTPRGLTCD